MDNKTIADILNAIADLMEIEDEKRIFEIKAYRKAAFVIASMGEDIGKLLEKEGTEGLMKIDGVGKGIAKKIREYEETGKISKYEELRKKFPFDVVELTRVRGVGPKTAYKLYKNLGVMTVEDLRKAVALHKIKNLEGFGEKRETDIATGLGILEKIKNRMLLGFALPYADRISEMIIESGLAERISIAGSIRRMKETIGDLDILVASANPEKIMDVLAGNKEVKEIIARGETKMTVMLDSGINCDLRFVEIGCFGAALQYFTGSKAHNVKLRKIAVRKGYKLNEYGLFNKKNVSIAGREEEEIYNKLGMDYMEPEMREDRGEIELAIKHGLPKLIEEKDIVGDLHVHTKYSDGTESMENMVLEAIRIGRKYIGFTDHSKSEHVANGMDKKKFEKYSEEIERLGDKYEGKIALLKSSETDILKDGSLDWDRKSLESMDYVLASVHMGLNMTEKEMTNRIVKCIESGKIDILGHPTDRLINQRPPLNIDIEKVFDAAEKNGVSLEINAFPERLDLNDENILLAKDYRVKFAINTDSHSASHLKLMRYGIGTARRGWIESREVINTRSLKDLKKFLC